MKVTINKDQVNAVAKRVFKKNKSPNFQLQHVSWQDVRTRILDNIIELVKDCQDAIKNGMIDGEYWHRSTGGFNLFAFYSEDGYIDVEVFADASFKEEQTSITVDVKKLKAKLDTEFKRKDDEYE